MSNPKVCERCGIVHSVPRRPFAELISKASQEIADDIDKQVMKELNDRSN
jgi:phage gpG-like protein